MPIYARADVADVAVRRARTSDVRTIFELVGLYAGRVLLSKELVTLYEDVQEFRVARARGHGRRAAGRCTCCGRTSPRSARSPCTRRRPGAGWARAIVSTLIATARELGLRRLFVLTFERQFFAAHGFVEIEGTPVSGEVYALMRRSYDAGVAEFLDLAEVKPNTLGNARMLREPDRCRPAAHPSAPPKPQ